MKKIMIILSVVMVSACSNGENIINLENKPFVTDQRNTLASFPYPLVKWNKQVYRVTTDEDLVVDGEIGEIVNHSTNETAESPDNFSNYFKKGTKIWSIKAVDTKEEIAVEYELGKYVKAISSAIE